MARIGVSPADAPCGLSPTFSPWDVMGPIPPISVHSACFVHCTVMVAYIVLNRYGRSPLMSTTTQRLSPQRIPLSRERVLGCALVLADESGIAGLTIRSLAT